MDAEMFWVRVFCNGGAIALAVLCIIVATRKEARGPFKWLLWAVAILLLVMQAGCWVIATKVGRALEG
jgi:hypothetical protein